MKFLEKINAEVLTRKQLRTIGGGRQYTCRCGGGGSSWSAEYKDDLSAAMAASDRCGGGVAYCD